MSMKRIFSFGLLIMGVAVGAAQAGVQSEFHLPFEAHWGEMTLAPGDYKLSLPERSLGGSQFLVASNSTRGYVWPMATDSDESLPGDSSHNYLKLVKVGGSYFVTQYRSETTGKTFNFAVPKSKHHLKMVEQDVVKVVVSRQ